MEDNHTESNLNLNDVSETAGTTAGYPASGEELSSREAELERERVRFFVTGQRALSCHGLTDWRDSRHLH